MAETKERLQIACIGSGLWGKNLVRNFHSLGVLKTVCDQDAARIVELAAQYPDVEFTESYSAVLADSEIDAVVIATPAATHGELARQAILAGKDVLVEKPICLSVEEAQSLVALAESRNQVLMVGHLLWYHPAVLKLRELVAGGELGRIRYIYSNRLNLGRIRREENILWSFAPHDISVILGLLGESPDSVVAQGGNYLHAGIADVTVSLLSFASGVRAHIFVSWLHPFKEQKLVVVGEKQMAVFDDLDPAQKLTLYPHSIEWRDRTPIPNKAEGRAVELAEYEPLRAEGEHFLECVQTRSQPRTDGHEAVRVLRVLRDCQDSLDLGSSHGPPVPSSTTESDLFVHESSEVEDDAEVGEGTKIWNFSRVLRGSKIGENCRIGQNVVVGPNVRIGDDVKIQNNVSVYEGVELEDAVFCGPSVVFTNVYNPRSEIRRMDELRPTLVRHGASLGANCTIMCGVTIGKHAFVGAGAVVLQDVPDHALVVGNPGKMIGWMCRCGNRIDFEDEIGACRSCGTEYRRGGGGSADDVSVVAEVVLA
jgi:UDP-2-acetamido-3-amino-2,3-dideoxy-glucuronate N-acetyltransferase